MLAGMLSGMAAAPGRADDVGITGRKLLIIDKLELSNKAAVRFLSLDGNIRKGSGTNAATIGATLDITIEAFNHGPIAGAFSVPQGFATTAGWLVNSATLARYVNPGAPGGPTQVRALTIQQNNVVKVATKGLGDLPINIDDLRFAPYDVQVRLTIMNGAETITHCTVFHSADCKLPLLGAGTGVKLQCRFGAAVPDCAFPPLP